MTPLSPAAQRLLARFVADPDLVGIEPGPEDVAACEELRRAGLLFVCYRLTGRGERAVKAACSPGAAARAAREG